MVDRILSARSFHTHGSLRCDKTVAAVAASHTAVIAHLGGCSRNRKEDTAALDDISCVDEDLNLSLRLRGCELGDIFVDERDRFLILAHVGTESVDHRNAERECYVILLSVSHNLDIGTDNRVLGSYRAVEVLADLKNDIFEVAERRMTDTE